MANESRYGSLFATSNGYMGIRGSFEENATLSVQGGFVRGLIDEIPFNQPLTIDNEYMRKYYVNEDAAKDADAGVEAALNAGMDVLAMGYAKTNPKATYSADNLKEAGNVNFN